MLLGGVWWWKKTTRVDAIVGDGAFAVLGNVEALGGFDVAGGGHPVTVRDRGVVAVTAGVVVHQRFP